MKDDGELLELIKKCLTDGLEELWDSLTPEERKTVFRKGLISEFIGANY